MLFSRREAMTRITCANCDTPPKFVPYTSLDFPGKVFCCAHCVFRYEQAKAQYDKSLQLQPVVNEDDACTCRLCVDDP
jgi:hypothetical protein